MIELISKVGSGVVAGIMYSLSSYAKKKDQEFDWVKFVSTIGFGAFVGLVHGSIGLDLSAANALLINLGAVPIVENVCKAIWRKLVPGN